MQQLSQNDILVQLYEEKKNELFDLGLPVKIREFATDPNLRDDAERRMNESMNNNNSGTGNNNGSVYNNNSSGDISRVIDNKVLVDSQTRKRYVLKEVDVNSGFYCVPLGQEVRIRVRNQTTGVSQKTIHFSVLYQDCRGNYHNLFPHFIPNLKRFANDFRSLSPQQETIISICTQKLMQPFMDQVMASSKDRQIIRFLVVATTCQNFQDIVQNLRQQIVQLSSSPAPSNNSYYNHQQWNSRCPSSNSWKNASFAEDSKLMVFNYRVELNPSVS